MSEDTPVTPPVAAPAEKPVEHHDEHAADLGGTAVHSSETSVPAPEHHAEQTHSEPQPVEHHDVAPKEEVVHETAHVETPSIVNDAAWKKPHEEVETHSVEPHEAEVQPVVEQPAEQPAEPEVAPESVVSEHVESTAESDNNSPYKEFYNLNPDRVSQMPTGEFMRFTEEWLAATKDREAKRQQLADAEQRVHDIEARVRGDDAAAEPVAESPAPEFVTVPAPESEHAVAEAPKADEPHMGDITTITPARADPEQPQFAL